MVHRTETRENHALGCCEWHQDSFRRIVHELETGDKVGLSPGGGLWKAAKTLNNLCFMAGRPPFGITAAQEQWASCDYPGRDEYHMGGLFLDGCGDPTNALSIAREWGSILPFEVLKNDIFNPKFRIANARYPHLAELAAAVLDTKFGHEMPLDDRVLTILGFNQSAYAMLRYYKDQRLGDDFPDVHYYENLAGALHSAEVLVLDLLKRCQKLTGKNLSLLYNEWHSFALEHEELSSGETLLSFLGDRGIEGVDGHPIHLEDDEFDPWAHFPGLNED